MYVYGIRIAHNYTITPDDAGMPPSNTTNIKVSPANISLRLVCKQIKFIKGHPPLMNGGKHQQGSLTVYIGNGPPPQPAEAKI